MLNDANWMKSAYFIIHSGKNPPPQNSCQLKSVFLFFVKSTGFTSSTFPIHPDFSQNQPVAITLHTGSPQTLVDAPQILYYAENRNRSPSSQSGACLKSCQEEVGQLL
jgi:hypothetical protein